MTPRATAAHPAGLSIGWDLFLDVRLRSLFGRSQRVLRLRRHPDSGLGGVLCQAEIQTPEGYSSKHRVRTVPALRHRVPVACNPEQ